MKYQKLICNSLIGLMGTTALAGFATIAYAANAENPAALEEIVVTATKRSEKLQNVPDSIKVFNAKDLENANIQNIRGFVQLTPNLIVRETFRTNETFLTMRGLSSAQGSLPPVAFVVDGIQLGSNDFINQDLMDIERIEVLRGPQGALYGQGAIAGAINVVTKQPTNDLAGMVKGSYGNGNTWRVAGSLSGPLVKDMLFAKASGYYKKSDGLIKNNAGDKITPYDEAYGRGQLTYKNENLSINMFGAYTNGKSYCCIQDIVQKQKTSATLYPGALSYTTSGAGPSLLYTAIYPGNTSFPTSDPAYTLINVDQVAGSPGPTSNILGKSWNRFANAGLKIDYDFDPFTFTSISGYNYVRQKIYGDADFRAVLGAAQDIVYSTKVYNQEVRFTSKGDGPFKWLFGGFYQYSHDVQHVIAGTDPGVGLNQEPGHIITFFPGYPQNNVTNHHSYAFFTSMSYDFTEKWQLAGAFRYDHDKAEAQNTLKNPLLPPAEATFNQPQPKVQLSYKWNPDVMIYTSFAMGFRSGGFSQNAKFDNELTKNYELGFKSTLLDGLAVLNGSFFHIDYQNQQLSFVQLNPVPLKGVVTIPKSSIDGMELELTARPADGLTVSLGAGMVDSVVKEIKPNILIPTLDVNQLAGNKSPLVSPFTFNASVNYVLPVANDFDILFHADFRREGGYYFDLANTIKTASHNLISGKIALEKDTWSVGVWGQNLTNSRYTTNVGVTGTPYRVPNQPRSYGIEASFKF